MLDLSVISRRLTQGQPTAAMVVAAVREYSAVQAGAVLSIEQADTAPEDEVDVVVISRRVLSLMRDDLFITFERCGGKVR